MLRHCPQLVRACVACISRAGGHAEEAAAAEEQKEKKTCVPRLWSSMEEEAVGLLPRLHAFLDSEGSFEALYALLRRS